jgi:hypothetical protein
MSYTLKATASSSANHVSLHHTARTSKLLLPASPTAECTQPTNELLEVDSASTAAEAVRHVPYIVARTCSSSKIAIIRDASGLFAICGIWRNSSRSMDPERSLCCSVSVCAACTCNTCLSSFMNRFFSRSSSFALTGRCERDRGDVAGLEAHSWTCSACPT